MKLPNQLKRFNSFPKLFQFAQYYCKNQICRGNIHGDSAGTSLAAS